MTSAAPPVPPGTATHPRLVDTDPFAELYQAEHAALVRLAALILGSTAAADDVVQETFARLHSRFANVRNPEGWLRVAVINGCRNEHRRLGVVRRHLASQPTRQVTDSVEAPELIESLRRLPLRQRTVVVLRFYEDRSEAEIAQLMHIRVGTVKSTLSRALVRLRQEVDL